MCYIDVQSYSHPLVYYYQLFFSIPCLLSKHVLIMHVVFMYLCSIHACWIHACNVKDWSEYTATGKTVYKVLSLQIVHAFLSLRMLSYVW